MNLNFKNWIICESEEHSYSCVLANFPNANSFISWSKKNIKKENLYTPEDGIETEPHVTCLYGLHTNNPVEISLSTKQVKQFSVTLGKISKFSNEKFDVIKIEVNGKELHNLNKILRKLPYTSNFDKYIAHCTLAYVKKGSCDDLIGDKYFKGKTIKIKELVFSSANGEKTTISLNKI